VAVGVLLLATLLAVPLFIYRGWPILAIGIPSLWFCYGYTGGPMPLAYRGLGELFVVLFFGLVAVSGSAFVQSGRWHFEALVAGVQIGMLSTVLIAINNLRDIEEDAKSGKRTLAVRFGVGFAKMEIFSLCALAYLLNIYWWMNGWPWWQLCDASILLGLLLCLRIWEERPSPIYNRFLAVAGAQLLLFAIQMVVVMTLSRDS
jgi:1,4-dihydroxy-2-naphthoate octaprenyltransferase